MGFRTKPILTVFAGVSTLAQAKTCKSAHLIPIKQGVKICGLQETTSTYQLLINAMGEPSSSSPRQTNPIGENASSMLLA